MKSKLKVIIPTIIVVLILIMVIIVIINRNKPEEHPLRTGAVNVVPTMLDKIDKDSVWCATFQLIWNDMKNELVGSDVILEPQEKMAENLNKEEFTEDMISDEYYFKTYGLKTLELKEKIEKGIKDKFNQTSDIIDDFDWSDEALDRPGERRYVFYSMLYREFDFLNKFDNLDNGNFGESYKNVKYFGINQKTKDKVGEQIDVLYYNSRDDFAIKLNTKTNDEIIFCKNPEGENFKEIYNNMIRKENSYTGDKKFQKKDEFKAPYLKFKEKREYTELENKEFEAKGEKAEIVKALQTIEFELNEKGGKIKSEAGMDTIKATAIAEKPKNTRYFFVDDTFAIFLKEKSKDIPYFGAKINDITKYQ